MHAFPHWQGLGAWFANAAKGWHTLFATADAGFALAMLCVPLAFLLGWMNHRASPPFAHQPPRSTPEPSASGHEPPASKPFSLSPGERGRGEGDAVASPNFELRDSNFELSPHAFPPASNPQPSDSRPPFLPLATALIFLIVCHYGGILQTRWFLPAYALFTLAAVYVLAAALRVLSMRRLRAARNLALSLLILLLALSWLSGWRQRLSGDVLGVGFHRVGTGLTDRSRGAFRATLPYERLGALVNERLPRDARVLVLQEPPFPQVRWYRRRFIQNGQYWLQDLVRPSPDAQTVAGELRRAGITHVVAPPEEMSGLRGIDLRPLLTPVAERDGCTIYRWKD
jgi:hypothetical protein